MPIVIPTTEEIDRMDDRQKAAWRRRMGVALQEANASKLLLKYGDMTRNQAEIWHRLYGTDPEAPVHRAMLLEALK